MSRKEIKIKEFFSKVIFIVSFLYFCGNLIPNEVEKLLKISRHNFNRLIQDQGYISGKKITSSTLIF